MFVCVGVGRPVRLDKNVCLRRSLLACLLLACRWEKLASRKLEKVGGQPVPVSSLQTVWCVASHGHVDSRVTTTQDLVFGEWCGGGISPVIHRRANYDGK